MFGSGSAGIGIVDLLIAAMKEEGLSEEQARKRIYAFNRYGLIVEGGKGIRPEQQPLARKREDVAGWKLSPSARDRRHFAARRGEQCGDHGIGRRQRSAGRVY